MRYRELAISVKREYLEVMEAALIGEGFDSMQIDDPADFLEIEEHPEWYKYDYINEDLAAEANRDPVITLYFPDDEEGRRGCERAADAVKRFSEANSGSGALMSVRETGDDSEWLYKWQEHFKPVRIGERIVVRPGWEDYSPEPEDLVIEMDPGMAFGSGLHGTTSMCVKALEKAIAEKRRRDGADGLTGSAGVKVLDVGTGTGILSIAAALLGADSCLGIDIDSEAVRVASENVEKNGLGGTVAIAKGDLAEGLEDFSPDIIVANLMADLVMRLSPAAAALLEPGGIYITSGILDIKEETVSEAIRDAGFEITEVLHDGEWRAIAARRR